mmetsp:Transcript_120397/g.209581  ORF Transcript_120397/g.209581 Transcript_120397/m.209581 type:complete len:516 (+) Transcript_120397:479-2026(+)
MNVNQAVGNDPVHHSGLSPIPLGSRPHIHHSAVDPAIVVCGPTILDSTSSEVRSSGLSSHTQGLRPLLVFSARVPAEAATSRMDAAPYLIAHKAQSPFKSSGRADEDDSSGSDSNDPGGWTMVTRRQRHPRPRRRRAGRPLRALGISNIWNFLPSEEPDDAKADEPLDEDHYWEDCIQFPTVPPPCPALLLPPFFPQEEPLGVPTQPKQLERLPTFEDILLGSETALKEWAVALFDRVRRNENSASTLEERLKELEAPPHNADLPGSEQLECRESPTGVPNVPPTPSTLSTPRGSINGFPTHMGMEASNLTIHSPVEGEHPQWIYDFWDYLDRHPRSLDYWSIFTSRNNLSHWADVTYAHAALYATNMRLYIQEEAQQACSTRVQATRTWPGAIVHSLALTHVHNVGRWPLHGTPMPTSSSSCPFENSLGFLSDWEQRLSSSEPLYALWHFQREDTGWDLFKARMAMGHPTRVVILIDHEHPLHENLCSTHTTYKGGLLFVAKKLAKKSLPVTPL